MARINLEEILSNVSIDASDAVQRAEDVANVPLDRFAREQFMFQQAAGRNMNKEWDTMLKASTEAARRVQGTQKVQEAYSPLRQARGMDMSQKTSKEISDMTREINDRLSEIGRAGLSEEDVRDQSQSLLAEADEVASLLENNRKLQGEAIKRLEENSPRDLLKLYQGQYEKLLAMEREQQVNAMSDQELYDEARNLSSNQTAFDAAYQQTPQADQRSFARDEYMASLDEQRRAQQQTFRAEVLGARMGAEDLQQDPQAFAAQVAQMESKGQITPGERRRLEAGEEVPGVPVSSVGASLYAANLAAGGTGGGGRSRDGSNQNIPDGDGGGRGRGGRGGLLGGAGGGIDVGDFMALVTLASDLGTTGGQPLASMLGGGLRTAAGGAFALGGPAGIAAGLGLSGAGMGYGAYQGFRTEQEQIEAITGQNQARGLGGMMDAYTDPNSIQGQYIQSRFEHPFMDPKITQEATESLMRLGASADTAAEAVGPMADALNDYKFLTPEVTARVAREGQLSSEFGAGEAEILGQIVEQISGRGVSAESIMNARETGQQANQPTLAPEVGARRGMAMSTALSGGNEASTYQLEQSGTASKLIESQAQLATPEGMLAGQMLYGTVGETPETVNQMGEAQQSITYSKGVEEVLRQSIGPLDLERRPPKEGEGKPMEGHQYIDENKLQSHRTMMALESAKPLMEMSIPGISSWDNREIAHLYNRAITSSISEGTEDYYETEANTRQNRREEISGESLMDTYGKREEEGYKTSSPAEGMAREFKKDGVPFTREGVQQKMAGKHLSSTGMDASLASKFADDLDTMTGRMPLFGIERLIRDRQEDTWGKRAGSEHSEQLMSTALKGESQQVAQLATMQGMDPSQIKLAGTDKTLADVENDPEELARIESGKQKLQVYEGGRVGAWGRFRGKKQQFQTLTAKQMSEMYKSGEATIGPGKGEFSVGGEDKGEGGDKEIRLSPKAEEFFDLVNIQDPKTGAGANAQAQTQYNANEGRGRMNQTPRY